MASGFDRKKVRRPKPPRRKAYKPLKQKRSTVQTVDDTLVFSRRGIILGGIGGLAMGGLVARLAWLQLEEAPTFKLLSEDNRFNFRLVPPSRGLIVDRYGETVANNRDNYRILIDAERRADVDQAIARLAAFLALDDGDVDLIRRRVEQRRRSFDPIVALEDVDWDTFARVNLLAPDLPFIRPDVGEVRYYAGGRPFSHVTGYVGAPSDEEAVRADPLLRQPGFKVGVVGLEETYDRALRGAPGLMKQEVDALGRIVREEPEPDRPAQQGETLQLTLDAEVQDYAYRRFSPEVGSAIVMDVHTGDLIAMVSAPSYDPNDFAAGISQADYAALRDHPHKPLYKRALSGQYPPGSTYKMVVALAAMEAGLIDTVERIFCTGELRLGRRTFHCWKRGGHGAMNMRDAIKQSCDTYFYEVARRVGVDRIADMSRRLGLGETYDLGISGQTVGSIPTEAWKRARFDEPWVMGDTFNVGIGQGYVTASPMQLAVMTARMVNGGKAVTPNMVMGRERAAPEVLDINKEHLGVMMDAMMAVCEEPRGTAFALGGLKIEGVRWGGKTGTSQVRQITMEERARGVIRNEDLPWERRDHGLFVAFAPYDDPQLAISVVVEHGGGGSSAAAPPARDILKLALERYQRPATPVAGHITPGVTTASLNGSGTG